MKIKSLTKELLDHFINKNCTQPKMCFANCARIVFSLHFGNYVLCWVTEADGQKHGHAVIEYKGDFFDPTLQAASLTNNQYQHVKTFTRDELIRLMEKHGAQFNNNAGTIEGFPPALMRDGSIQCV